MMILDKRFRMSLLFSASFRLVCSLFMLVAVAGCSGLKTYPNTADKNLEVRTKLSGTLLTGVDAFLHLYSSKDGCPADYLGTVELKNDLTQVGIAPGQPTYVKFIFRTSARLGGSSALTLPYYAILTPRADSRFIADVSYADSMHNVVIREVGPRGTRGREIERRTTRDCPKTGSGQG